MPSKTRLQALILPFVVIFTTLVVVVYYASVDRGVSTRSGRWHLESRDVEAAPDDISSVSLPSVNASSVRRRQQEDYTCAPGRPCSNKACCGPEGVCGYGPDYCGSGCSSNCDAHAECGIFAETPGKQCPLNVCCSEFGFCGSTREFCIGKCQSNCVEHPSPPGGSPTGQTLSKVIGYYESWNVNSPCRRTLPTDLPLDALTHVNYAFVFLDPRTYQITPMDGSTPAQLFADTAAIKLYKPSLQVWISLGGWTFSDDGTATQPLLGEIARDASKRQQFANNVLNFLESYAFDGIDIDWEYPGAPDRGGHTDDVPNFVLLMQTLRQTLNRSPRRLGISFTIPASYWYLRWFDVPGLLRYADFTNLMSYDIHGTWDRDNALGNIIRPHTNLTEIKLAVELLWRVGVRPDQVSVGFGFYGRSFTLSDPSCSVPGRCRFSGGGAPGLCTGTSGYLAYYEIQDIIAKNPGIVVHHDQEAAIKYISWGNNQWVSYDDVDTFKQKVDWANSVGFSGSLIWASDLDDNNLNAHKGLLGRPVRTNEESANQQTPQYTVLSVDTNYGTQCYMTSNCLNFDAPSYFQPLCGSGEVQIGFDRSDCKGNWGKPICCRASTAPKSCTWRGGGLDCNGQCHEGEVNLFQSKKGGGPASESGEKKCNRGSKAFCCQDEVYKNRVTNCRWTGCGGSCNGDESAVARLSNDGRCGYFSFASLTLCCKGNPVPLQNCHWVGTGDCAHNTCNSQEVTVQRHPIGDGWAECNWYRQKSLCCTPDRSLDEFMCTDEFCGTYPDECPFDPFQDLNPNDEDDGFSDQFSARDLERRGADRRSVNAQVPDPNVPNSVLLGIYIIWHLFAARYPGPSSLFNGRRGTQAYGNAIRPQGGTCSTTGIEKIGASGGRMPNPYAMPEQYQNDHPIELQYLSDFLETVTTGLLPNGVRLPTHQRIDSSTIQNYWFGDRHGLPQGLISRPAANVPTVWDRWNINDRLYTILGSNYNRQPFRILHGGMNNMKGKIYAGQNPVDLVRFGRLLRNAVATGQGEEDFLVPLRQVVAIFHYLFDPDVEPQIQRQRRQIRRQLEDISRWIPQLAPLIDIWTQFDPIYFQTVATNTQTWLRRQIRAVQTAYNNAVQGGTTPANYQRVINELNLLLQQVGNVRTFNAPGSDQPGDR